MTTAERARMVLLDDAERALADALAGRVVTEEAFRERLAREVTKVRESLPLTQPVIEELRRGGRF
ncbi:MULTISPECIES: hypothetical protein [Paraburkholderia]|uniref:Uncharacterized protein n=1 Tax=Paraburkholderia podalyriae TaxID=1938811 RepID=A0ABR7PQM5_9BURK|nr:hypothetical protein [Paraburkholderia podalyriae]MBC8748582.1 hypothetical protein [Paraburkholderia podalyriae]